MLTDALSPISTGIPPSGVRPGCILLLNCLPLTICRRVVPVMIDPPNSHTGWSFPHVLQKVGKCEPTFTYMDPSAAICRVRSIPGIVASANHPSPRTVGFFLAGCVLSKRIAYSVSGILCMMSSEKRVLGFAVVATNEFSAWGGKFSASARARLCWRFWLPFVVVPHIPGSGFRRVLPTSAEAWFSVHTFNYIP